MWWLISQIEVSNVMLFLIVLAIASMIQSYLEKPPNLPPTPAFRYPILGHLPYLKENMRGTLARWKKETGDIYSLYFGSTLVIVLNSIELFKEALVKQGDKFSDRAVPLITRSSGIKEARGVVDSSGLVWKEHRAITQVIMRHFGMGKNCLAQKIQEEVIHYLDEVASFNGVAKEVRTLTNNSISNTICSIVIGRRFDYDDADFIKLLNLLEEQFKFLASNATISWIPVLRFFPFTNLKQAVRNGFLFRDNFASSHIRRIKESMVGVEDADNFIAAYLMEMERKNEKGQATTLHDEQLRMLVTDLFFAGTETTSTAMMWFLLYMIHHPEKQENVYKEIKKVVGTDRFPTMTDKDKLNYLNACIMETQRISSIIPTNLLHLCNSETTLQGYTIPENTLIMPCLDSVLLDEKTWGDPHVFRPERFLNKNGEIVVPESFIPFSMGRRVCLGEPLAKMELFLYLASLIQRFELRPSSPTDLPPLVDDFALTCPPRRYKLRFIERDQ